MLQRLWQMQSCISKPQIAPQDKERQYTDCRSRGRNREHKLWAGRQEKYFLAVV